MTLPFEEEVVNDLEYSKYNFEHPQFIGYLNPYGDIIEYSSPLGFGGHDGNKLTNYFEYYFRMPSHDLFEQQFENKNVINLEIEKKYCQDGIQYFKKCIEDYKEYRYMEDPYFKFQKDLDIFFYHCYQSDTFMDGFGKNCMSLNQSEFYEQFCKNNVWYQEGKNDTETEDEYKERMRRNIEYDYHWYRKRLMLDWYKTVIVQYMHYHLIERCERGITTSNVRPYETFYNYLLNDFTIHQIPCMVYDRNQKKYVEYSQNPFLIPDSELRLKEEIVAIKKLVPRKDRVKYYR